MTTSLSALLGSLLLALSPQAPGSQPTPAPKRIEVGPRATLLWKTLVRRCASRAALAGAVSYVAHDRFLSRIDAGRTVWSTEVGPTEGAPIFDAQRVYVGTESGTLVAVDRKTGRSAWKVACGNAIRSAPALRGSAVYVESSDGCVYAVEAASGTRLWKFERPDGSLGYADPILAGDAALYVCGETTLYRLDPLAGTLVWKQLVGGKALATPARAAGRLIVGGDGCGLSALSEDDGRRLWRFPAAGKSTDWYGPPLVSGGVAYVGTVRGLVYAVDIATGRRLWATTVPGEALSRPTLDARHGVVYVALTAGSSSSPSVLGLDARTGLKRVELKLGEVAASPAISGDRLYVGSLGGFYHAFSLQ